MSAERSSLYSTVLQIHSYTPTSHDPTRQFSSADTSDYTFTKKAVFLLYSTRSCRIAIGKKTLPPYHPPQPSVIDNEIRFFCCRLTWLHPSHQLSSSIFHTFLFSRSLRVDHDTSCQFKLTAEVGFRSNKIKKN
jgi:hypothetical protein